MTIVRSVFNLISRPLSYRNIVNTRNFGLMTQSKRTKLAWIGGSWGGLPSLKHFIKQFEALDPEVKDDPELNIDIYLIDPRAGFINVLGIPKALIDVEFAKNIYLNVEKYNLKFDTVETKDEDFKAKMDKANFINEPVTPKNLHLHFIHGKCISFLDKNTLTYQLSNDEETKELQFDYAVFSTGRKRNWPMDPVAYNESDFVAEIEKYKPNIENAQTISIIGAGALGIEVAGEFKEAYPEKRIILIHPHPFLPPETYAAENLKTNLKKHLIDVGVELKLSTRIAKELPNGDLITVNDETIKSDLNLWCNSHRNNIEPLLPFFKDSIIEAKGEVEVETNMLMKNQKNIFVIGDIVHLPIVKTAGAAYLQGEKVADSLINLVVKHEEKYETIDLNNWPHGMTIVVGVNKSVSQWDDTSDEGRGKVVIDDPDTLAFYKDYVTDRTRFNLNIAK